MEKSVVHPAFYTKIKSELFQTAYLNGRLANAFDLCQVSRQGVEFATELISRIIMDEEMEMSFIANETSIDDLAGFFQQAYRQNGRAEYLEIGIGFPMFCLKSEAETVLAPLFVWPVRLTPDYADRWHIGVKRNEAVLNYLLADFLKEKYGVEVVPPLEKCLRAEGEMDEAIYKTCYELLVEMGWQDERSTIAMKTWPDDLATKGSIRWSGVLGLFGVQERRVFNEMSRMDFPEWRQEHTGWAHPFGALPLAAEQEKAMQTLRTSTVIVAGNDGTGIFDLATNAAINALSNKKKVLIVGNDYSGLNNIAIHFQQLNLEYLTLPLFQQNKYEPTNSATDFSDFDHQAFNLHLQKAMRHYQTLNRQHYSVSRPIFGQYNWSDTVGLFLKKSQRASPALLNSHLHIEKFDWSSAVYGNLSKLVEEGFDLFKRLGTTAHPLKALNDRYFLTYDFDTAKADIHQKVQHLRQHSQQLRQQYIDQLHQYTRQLNSIYQEQVQTYQQASEDLLELMADLDSQHGKTGTASSMLHTGKLKITSLFSKKHQHILAQQQAAFQQYQHLKDKFDRQCLFEQHFPMLKGGEKIAMLRQTIAGFKQQLSAFQQNIPYLIQQQKESLSATNQTEWVNADTVVQDLHTALRTYLDFLNQSQLFNARFAADAHTIYGQQNYLEQIDNQITMIEFNMRDFQAFYDWQRYWLQLSPAGQEVMEALTKINPPNWTAAFQSWYLHQFLTQYHDDTIPENNKIFDKFWASFSLVQQEIPAQINALWTSHNRRQPSFNLSLFKNKNNDFSENKFSLTPPADVSRLTEKYPLVLLSPKMALEWVPPSRSPFDLVIVLDELPLYHYGDLLRMAPKTLALTSSDSKQNHTDLSLTTYLSSQNVTTVELANHYASGSKALAQLKFDTYESARRYRYFNKIGRTRPIKTETLDIRYRSATDLNNHYATRLENQLKRISAQAPNRPKRIRIIVEDPAMRRFLFYRLYLKRIGHTEMANVLQHLFPNGIQFQSPDDIPVSDTDILFYVKSLQKNHWNEKAYEKIISGVRDELVYIMPNQPDTADSIILKHAAQHTPLALTNLEHGHKDYPTPSVLHSIVDVISERLASSIGDTRYSLQVWRDAFYFPFLMLSIDGQPTFVIAIDGLAEWACPPSALWEWQYRKLLSQQNLTILYLWSVDWWKNPDAALDKLLDDLQKQSIVHAK